MSAGEAEYSVREVTVLDMAKSREARVLKQNEILARYSAEENKIALVSFMLNIMGAVKKKPLYDRAFFEGVKRIKEAFCKIGADIIEESIEEKFTGSEYLALVNKNPLQIKQTVVELEEMDILGRIFDIDVLRSNGEKVERSEVGKQERKCLLCSLPAHVCSRNRTHSLASLVSAIERIISEQLE